MRWTENLKKWLDLLYVMLGLFEKNDTNEKLLYDDLIKMIYNHKTLPRTAKIIEWKDWYYQIFKWKSNWTMIWNLSQWEAKYPNRELIFAIEKDLIENSSDWIKEKDRVDKLIDELDDYHAFKIKENCRQYKFREALKKYLPKIV